MHLTDTAWPLIKKINRKSEIKLFRRYAKGIRSLKVLKLFTKEQHFNKQNDRAYAQSIPVAFVLISGI